MRAWKTLSRREVFARRPWITLEQHEILLPDGRAIDDWIWVCTPDFVNVLARAADGRFVVFRQTKYAADGVTLAPVGGYLDEDEDPLDAAKRELLEETGYVADDWLSLGAYAADGNRGCGRGHLYFARNARRVADPHADDLEEQELLLLTLDEITSALMRGEFKVAPWAACVAMSLLALERGR